MFMFDDDYNIVEKGLTLFHYIIVLFVLDAVGAAIFVYV